MDTTENLSVLLDSVANNSATTMWTGRSHNLNRTFEAIEDVAIPVRKHFEALVVIVSAKFTFSHIEIPFR